MLQQFILLMMLIIETRFFNKISLHLDYLKKIPEYNYIKKNVMTHLLENNYRTLKIKSLELAYLNNIPNEIV